MRVSGFDFKQVMLNDMNGKQIAVFEDKDHSPMVLMDAIGGAPILAVSVVPSDGKGLMTKRGDAFQCIFEKDKQSFSMRVSNFTQHNVAFYIRSKGKCVNKINMVQPSTTTIIKSDFSNEEREMFLDTLDEKVSVAQDETRADGSAAKGTYFTIEVAPTQSEEDWRESVWLCPDFVCQPVVPDFGRSFGGFGDSRPVACFGTVPFGGGDGFRSKGGFGAGYPNGWGSAGGISSTPVANVSSFYEGGFGSAEPMAAALAFGGPPSPSYGGGPDEYDLPEFAAYEDDAFAANVRHGAISQQASRTIHCAVHFKMGSKAVTLCLSVMKPDKVHIFPPMSENVRIHKMLECLYDFITGKNARLLASLKQIHEEKECAICLSEPPQCIFIKCGHCAICNSCKTQLREQKCPLCRGFITASIQK